MRWRSLVAAIGLVAAPLHAGQDKPARAEAAPVVDPLVQAQRSGRTANSLGRFAEAEAAFRTALDLQTGAAKASDVAVATTLLDLALNVSNQGRSDEAEALFRRAEPMIQRSGDTTLRARLATYQALDANNRGDVAVGARFAADAVEQWRALAARGSTQVVAANDGASGAVAEGEFANALNLQARLELAQDNILPAYGAASEALLILNRSTVAPRWWKADSLIALGEISIAQGRISAAETYFNSAIKIRRQLFGDGVPTIKALAALGRAYQREGLNTSAIVTYREVFRLARALPSTAGVFTADMLVPFAAAVVATAETLKDAEERRGLYAEAFDAFQLVQSPVVDRTIAQAAARLSAGNPQMAALIGEVQDRQREADQVRLRLATEQALPDAERSGDEEARLKARIAATDAAMTQARAALTRAFPDYQQLVAVRPVRLDALRALLKPGEGLVSFLIGRDRSFAQLVTRQGVLVAAVPEGEAGLRDTVTTLRRPLEVQGGAIAEFNMTESHRLHDELFGGLGSGLTGVDHLVVVPAGPLSNLPFGLLVASTSDDGSYEKADWLIRRRAIAYTPSLQAFSQLRLAKRVAAPSRPLLGFGDPTLTGAVLVKAAAKLGAAAPVSAMVQLAGACRQGGPMPASLLRALAPLPDTKRELDAVARSLGAPEAGLFLENQATEANLRRQPIADYRVLYFATHGLLPGELRCQAEPGLVLTPPSVPATSRADDGLLESSEIAGMRLNADLVVLSACNTAAGSGQQGGGEALSGLAEAFFHAGARNMVVSHWQVPSAATTELMTGLFRNWEGGHRGIGDALRQSQLALVANPRTAHPFFWAAFVTVGDGLGEPAAAPAKSVAVAAR